MTKILQSNLKELAFLLIDEQNILSQNSKNNFQMFSVFVNCFVENEYIIKIYYDEFIQVSTKNFIHQSHKCRWGIS